MGKISKQEIEEEKVQTKPIDLKIYIIGLLVLIIVAFIFWGIYSSTINQQTIVSTTTTSTQLKVTTTTSTTTSSTTTTTTIDPITLYPQMTVNQFINNCNSSAIITSGIVQRAVMINETLQTTFVLIGTYGKVLPLANVTSSEKPTTLDATGSTQYKIYGTPVVIGSNSSIDCQMNVQRISQ